MSRSLILPNSRLFSPINLSLSPRTRALSTKAGIQSQLVPSRHRSTTWSTFFCKSHKLCPCSISTSNRPLSSTPQSYLPRRRDSTLPPASSPPWADWRQYSPPSSSSSSSSNQRDHGHSPKPQQIPGGTPSPFRAILFFTTFSLAAYGLAANYSLDETARIAGDIRSSRGTFGDLTSFFTGESPSDTFWGSGVSERRLRIAKKQEEADRLGLGMNKLMGWCDQIGLPQGFKQELGRLYIITAESYLDLPSVKQVAIPIIGLNLLIFVSWKLGSVGVMKGQLRSLMKRSFTHNPSSGRHYTMLTSCFSHQGGLHFLFNNVALWSIGGGALAYTMASQKTRIPECSLTPHFLSFFAISGVFAALVSHLVTAIRFRRVAALRGLSIAKATVGRESSLGSSGAVYAALVLSACAFPEASISLIFLPFFSFPIGWGVSGLVLFDLLGALRGWAIFDHFAHLGGALFGYGYFYHGAELWEWTKTQVLRLRSPPADSGRLVVVA
ncbi:hypothetical protein IE53DRAFT_371726 [Violaceomyces palustris]|uniref:Uncharacterized protein n=1 Tax=Violaceomyces palustris TaxID=1673888 RepID=A0ACD0NMY1_9BASI|nr:hypothetical protein IE53DRAFT_371726 [Violaceomyces palustris]